MFIAATLSQGKADHSHLNATKAPTRKNRLSKTAYSHGKQTSMLKKLLTVRLRQVDLLVISNRVIA
jgi:ribosomal protein L35